MIIFFSIPENHLGCIYMYPEEQKDQGIFRFRELQHVHWPGIGWILPGSVRCSSMHHRDLLCFQFWNAKDFDKIIQFHSNVYVPFKCRKCKSEKCTHICQEVCSEITTSWMINFWIDMVVSYLFWCVFVGVCSKQISKQISGWYRIIVVGMILRCLYGCLFVQSRLIQHYNFG